jgi:hypothetical protein
MTEAAKIADEIERALEGARSALFADAFVKVSQRTAEQAIAALRRPAPVPADVRELYRAVNKVLCDHRMSNMTFDDGGPYQLVDLCSTPGTSIASGELELGIRDWSEDFAHENGDYMCRCIKCGNSFRGYKRRIVCKWCARERAPLGHWTNKPPLSSDPTDAESGGASTGKADTAEGEALIKRLRAVSIDLGFPSTTSIDSAVLRQAADELAALRARLAEGEEYAKLAGLLYIAIMDRQLSGSPNAEQILQEVVEEVERRERALAEAKAQGERWRAAFEEITAKATPYGSGPADDPDRITSYIIPAGPLHRAAGKTGCQAFGLKESVLREYLKDMEENVIPKIIADENEQRRLVAQLRIGAALDGAKP